MDVTRSNFEEALQLVREEIASADVIAFDWELTGLQYPPQSAPQGVETLQDYYAKNRRGAQAYSVTQFGLCLARDRGEAGWELRPFNFWLYPRKFRSNEPTFTAQASSLEFLAANHFDFNKWVREGVGFLRSDEVERLRRELDERDKSLAQLSRITPNEADQKGVDERMSLVAKWVAEGAKEPFLMPPSTPFMRRLTYQALNDLHPLVFAQHHELPDRQATIKLTLASSPEHKEQLKAEEKAQKQREIDDAAGFTRVVELILGSKKPLVGHNCFLDLLHLHEKFVQRLPESYAEWKGQFQLHFPHIFDTKYISITHPEFRERLSRGHLSDLHKRLQTEPYTPLKHSFPTGFTRYEASDKQILHEAGYDALITCLAFLGLGRHLGQNPSAPAILENEGLLGYRNWLNVYGMAGTYANLRGDDRLPDMSKTFFVGPFDATTTTKHLTDHFNALLPQAKFRIKWKNDVSAFLELESDPTDDHRVALQTPSVSYPLTPFAIYAERQQAPPPSSEGGLKRKAEEQAGEEGSAKKHRPQ